MKKSLIADAQGILNRLKLWAYLCQCLRGYWAAWPAAGPARAPLFATDRLQITTITTIIIHPVHSSLNFILSTLSKTLTSLTPKYQCLVPYLWRVVSN